MALIKVKAKPGSKESYHQLIDGQVWQIWVKAPPVEGKANQAIIKYLAKVLEIRSEQVVLKTGHNSSFKFFMIDLDPSVIEATLTAKARD